MWFLRVLLIGEAAAYAAASLIHAEIVLPGNSDPAAATAEGIIAAVLVLAAGLSAARPGWTRGAALAAQAFALLGDLVGLTLFLVVEPERTADIVFHIVIAVILIGGLVYAARLRGESVAG
jgi:hypothetical protein